MRSRQLLLLTLLAICALPSSALVSGIFNYEVDNNKAIITGFASGASYSSSVTIPGSITQGTTRLFTKVGDGAFQNNKTLKSVVIEWGCQMLGANAFAGCSNMETLHIPRSMMYSSVYGWMGDGCLTGCTSLQTLSMNVDYAPTVSASTLEGIPSSCVIYVPVGNPHESDNSVTGYYNFVKNTTWNKFTLRTGSYDYLDPETNLAFYLVNTPRHATVVKSNKVLSGNVTIPSTITYDGIEYPVTAIERQAFAGQTQLTGITMPETITSLFGGHGEGSMSYDNAADNGAQFRGCTALTNVTLSTDIEYIPTQCFAGCSSLTTIAKMANTTPNVTIKEIGADAFSGTGIYYLRLPSTMT